MDKEDRIDDDGVDRILQLPGHLVERIISFLPLKDAVRTNILSKRWGNLWITAPPKLEFYRGIFGCEPYGIHYDEEMKTKKRVDLLNFMERTLRLCHSHSHSHSHGQIVSIPKLDLHFPVYFSEVATTLDRCIRYAIACNAKELNLDIDFLEYGLYNLSHTVFAAKSLTKLSLYGCKLEFSSCVNMNFSSLKELSFLHVSVDDQILQNLIANCPLIEDLQLHLYGGSNRILKISGLVNPKLVNVTIFNGKFERIEIEVPGLKCFCFGRIFKHMPIELNVSTCKNMRLLYLDGITITDELLYHVISKLCLLESLTLSRCDMLKSIKISSRRLKDVDIYMCTRLFNVEIDVPNLTSFDYVSENVISFSSNSLYLLSAYISLHPTNVDTHWYVRLTEFLRKFKNSESLQLVCNSYKNVIVPKELGESLLPPLYNVKHLSLSVRVSPSDAVEEILDGMLWFCPHPESLSIASDSKKLLYLKFYYNEMDRERYICRCSSFPITCWRHCLKEFKIEVEEDIERKIKLFLEHKLEILLEEIDGQRHIS